MQQRLQLRQICVTIAHKFVLFSIIKIYIFLEQVTAISSMCKDVLFLFKLQKEVSENQGQVISFH